VRCQWYLMLRKTLCVAGLGLTLLVGKAAGASLDGPWRLLIEGHQAFVFGEPSLGGGIRFTWKVVIDFQVQQGRYLIGSGSARWLGPPEPLSWPDGWFRCSQVEGTYLDSSLALHETPRLRFSAFPVAGRLQDGRVRLQPGYTSPGNYLAVTYECSTDNALAENWFAFAERGKQVLGKRQDAETRHDRNFRSARVREVASLPPASELELPLQDGWSFARGSDDGASSARYVLRRLP